MRATIAARVACLAALALSPASLMADEQCFGSVEFLLLAPKVNSTGFENLFYDGVDLDVVDVAGNYEDELKGGVRFIFGKETCCGFGGQVRYFHYDNDIGYDGLWEGGAGTVAIAGENSIKVNALDLEFTQRGKFHCWDLVATGGLRWGSVDISVPTNFFGAIAAVVFGGPTGVDFEGVGPTVSLSAQRPLGYGLSVFGRARTALLFGDIDVVPAFRAAPFTIQDEFAQVWEFQLGLNATHEFNGHTVFGGVFWEAQRWDSDSNFIGDLGLVGLGLNAGASY